MPVLARGSSSPLWVAFAATGFSGRWRCLTTSNPLRPTADSASEEELDKARAWLAALSLQNMPKLPKDAVEIQASRSSGPGGQNVNKVNSKATMRIDVPSLLSQVPPILHSALFQSPYFKPGVNKLVFQSDNNRKLSQNETQCWTNFYNVLMETGKAIPGKTSAEQQQRVRNLDKKANERRIREKKAHSSKKSGRKGSGKSEM